MSTDFQQARQSLGARLNEMRAEAGLTTRQLAERCGWTHSKVSKLENGRQTATGADLESWTRATGRLDDLVELRGRLRGLETTYRSWRRQLAAGHRAVQELNVAQEREAEHIRLFEPAIIPGIFQTPEYARCVLTDVSERHGKARDIEAGVRARMRRQDVLYEPGHRVEAIIWEAALYVARCAPEGMAAQLDRLLGLIGLESVQLGVVPLGKRLRLSPKHGFWVIDDGLVVADTWNAEMWLDTAEDIALYVKIWDELTGAALYDADARRLIARARASIDLA
ncbi:helix-turn-helix domain-containing protein [Streptomyces sulphureus]|uniref:helix-turn-helix domain-containing protein n=1 Tax=Streptomyces sulphureus TaxID=47758 RepID=UPI000376408E|nr:helix-turn-helix transcriptional regulator [Streptomyces sulphureus]